MEQSASKKMLTEISTVVGIPENLSTELKMKALMKEAISFRQLMSYYQCAIMEVETKFKVLNEEFSLKHDRNPIESIKTRLKSIKSIQEKMQRKDVAFTTENIEDNLNDIAGIRVVCSFHDDVYMLADALLNQDDITLLEKKDYIKNPKDNGYRSLHLIVQIPIFLSNQKRYMKVEIQLRTMAMDFWASLEHHIKYKKVTCDDEFINEELRQCAQMSADLDERMASIKQYIIEHSV